MPEDEVTSDAPQETTSETGVSEEELSESTSDDETTEPDADDESEPEGDDESAEDDGDDGDADQPPSDDDDDESWKNFNKKFAYLKSDRDRRAAMGKAWWEKTRYASQVRKENEELKARLARLEQPPDTRRDEEPQQPPPELARIEQRIAALTQKDQVVQDQQNKALIALSASDKEVAVIEDRLKDADEYQKAVLEQRLETAKVKRESILNRWADLNEKRESISLEMEQRITDKDWTAKFLQDKAQRDQLERRDIETFNAEFPKHVDGLIKSAADDLGAPPDQKIRQSLWKTVNRAMMVDLLKLGEKGLGSVNVPAMVRAHVKEYLEDRDLVGRTKFSKTSAEKLKVAGREAGKPASRPAPARPVPPALLTQGDTTPGMRRARERLVARFGGK